MKPPTCSRCGVPIDATKGKPCTCPVFYTITGEDWRASLIAARKHREKTTDRINAQINPPKP